MKIEISDSVKNKLDVLCEEWYSVKGEKPMPRGKAIEQMIRREWDKFSPPQYQTSGFERL